MLRWDAVLFLGLTFGFSWTVGSAIYAYGLWRNPALVTLTSVVFMMGPAIGALITAVLFDRHRMLDALGLHVRLNWIWLWAWAFPLVMIAGAIVVDWTLSDARFDPIAHMTAIFEQAGQDPADLPVDLETLLWVQLIAALTIGPAINTVVSLSEELGWRGWLWDRWRPSGFWVASLTIGVIWGLWHMPLVVMGLNYPGMPVAGPLLMVIFCVILSPLMGWVREAGGSVLHASLFHGTMNAASGLVIIALGLNAWPYLGIVGLGGFLTGLALWLVPVLARRQARERASGP